MQLGNWIRQTTTTTGTGDLTLSSVSGFPTFASQFSTGADGTGDYFYYAVVDDTTGAPIEAGFGRMSDSTTLVRSRVLASYVSGTYSEANTAVTLASGTKRVICADLLNARRVAMPGLRASETNRFIGPANINTGGGNSKTLNDSLIYAHAFEVVSPCIVSGMGCYVTTSASGSSVRLGLYRLNSNMEASGLIDGTGDITTATTGWRSGNFAGGSRRIKPGWYYAALKSFSGTPAVFGCEANQRIISLANLASGDNYGLGVAMASGTSTPQALPSPMPTLTWSAALSEACPVAYLVAAAP